MKNSNKDGSKDAKELIMKVVYSVDSSARSKNLRDITKIFEIKKAANQRLAAVSRPACTIFELISHGFKAFSQHSGLKTNVFDHFVILRRLARTIYRIR